jgi:hypothetical protein
MPVADGLRPGTEAMPGIDVVVPARNEEHRLGPTLDGLSRALAQLGVPARIVVVDNGSTDRTSDIALARRGGAVSVSVVRCAVRGKGAAVRAGVLSSSARWIGYADADAATDWSALQLACGHLHAGADVVVGSRAHVASEVAVRHSAARQWGAAAFRNLVANLVPAIGDTQCGFKFFDASVARELFGPLVTTGFAFDVEILARAHRRGLRVVEMPVVWHDVPGSTFSPLRDGWRSFRDVAAIAWRLRDVPDGAAGGSPSSASPGRDAVTLTAVPLTSVPLTSVPLTSVPLTSVPLPDTLARPAVAGVLQPGD